MNAQRVFIAFGILPDKGGIGTQGVPISPYPMRESNPRPSDNLLPLFDNSRSRTRYPLR